MYREYGRLVYAVAHKVLGDKTLAEDATQQAFVQAWKAASTFDPSRDLGPWLATIARRAAIDVHRRESRRAAQPLDDVAAGHPAVVTLPPSAEQAYDVWEVRRAIDELPDRRARRRAPPAPGRAHPRRGGRTPRRARRYREVEVVPRPQAPGRAARVPTGGGTVNRVPPAAVDTCRKVKYVN